MDTTLDSGIIASDLILPKPAPGSDSSFHLPLGMDKSGAGTFSIMLSTDMRSRDEALELINRRYAWRGYGSNHKLSGRRHETTFNARLDDVLIGTVTLATDSVRGLSVDQTFPDEMKFFRRKRSGWLCELKKFAMDYRSPSTPVLASLFHFIFIYGTNNYLATDLLIEVNPRHASFYEKMLGFQRVGLSRTNLSVGAPSQLMWLPVNAIERAITNRNDISYENTLYKHFYSEEMEERIVHQLNVRGLRENRTKVISTCASERWRASTPC